MRKEESKEGSKVSKQTIHIVMKSTNKGTLQRQSPYGATNSLKAIKRTRITDINLEGSPNALHNFLIH